MRTRKRIKCKSRRRRQTITSRSRNPRCQRITRYGGGKEGDISKTEKLPNRARDRGIVGVGKNTTPRQGKSAHKKLALKIRRINSLFKGLNQIEQKIHVTWKNKNVLEVHSKLNIIKYGILNLKQLNPEYTFEISDDADVMSYLLDKLSPDDFKLLQSRKFVEISDLWRLLKLYHEGGVYMDIDRLCDQPLSNIITSPAVKYVLPTYRDTDFSQDIMISCSRNPIIARAIELNLQRRREGEVDIMTLGPHSYFHAITEVLTGRRLERKRNNRLVLDELRALISQTDCLATFRESPPFYTILYRGVNVKIDKDMLYERDNVAHWQS